MKRFAILMLISFVLAVWWIKSSDIYNNRFGKYSDNIQITETEKPNLEKFDKSDAEIIDTEVWGRNAGLIKAHNDLMQCMEYYADYKTSELDVYNICEIVEKLCDSANNAYPYSENKSAKTYIDNGKTFCSYLKKEATLLKKYVSSKNSNDLLKLQEQIDITKKGIITLSSNRGVFLRNNGFTEDEIKAKANEIDNQIK